MADQNSNLFYFELEKNVKYKIFSDRFLLSFKNEVISVYDLSGFKILFQVEDRVMYKALGKIKRLYILHTFRDLHQNFNKPDKTSEISPFEKYFEELDLKTIENTVKEANEYDVKNNHKIDYEKKAMEHEEIKINEIKIKHGYGNNKSDPEQKVSIVQQQCDKNPDTADTSDELDKPEPLDENLDDEKPHSLDSLLQSLSTNPNIERAMNKSLYLSKGTVLDTNWKNVEKQKDDQKGEK